MSRKKTKKTQKKVEKGSQNEKKVLFLEILTAVLILTSVFIWISLANFSVNSGESKFFTGTVGFNTAHYLINIFGVVSYLVPLVIVLFVATFLKRTFIRHLVLNLILIAFMLPFFAMLSKNYIFYGVTNENYLGRLMYSKFFVLYFGKTGFILLVICCLILYSILTFNFSYFYIFKKIGVLWKAFLEKTKGFKLIDRSEVKEIDESEESEESEEDELVVNDDDKAEHFQISAEVEPVEEEPIEELPPPLEDEPLEQKDISVSVKEEDKKPQKTKALRTFTDYKLPNLSLLAGEDKVKKVKDREKRIKETALLIERKLLEHRLKVSVKGATIGPVVTMYEIELGEGVRVNQIAAMEQDIAVVVGGRKTRVVSSIPGKPYIGIEVPNDDRIMIRLRSILDSEMFSKHSIKGLPIALGQTVEGKAFATNLTKMPHLLVAGTTGSGKSVGINTMVVSLLFSLRPDEVKFLMIDPKGNEFNIYEGIPHLLLPVVVDSKKAAKTLMWAVNEMEERFHRLAENMVRDIDSYNEKVEKINNNLANVEHHMKKMPYIVVVIDEFADLMMVAGKDVEISVSRIAQKARAVGIHLIIATQRPTRDVVTGLIKGNLPVRIAFRVASALDSRTILDSNGAEMLLGNGDMLFIPPGSSEATRVHGAYVSTDEIKTVVKFIKDQIKNPEEYETNVMTTPPQEFIENDMGSVATSEEERDPLYDEILDYVRKTQKCSASMLQRKFKIGYNRAARAVETLEEEGAISEADGSKPRQVLIK